MIKICGPHQRANLTVVAAAINIRFAIFQKKPSSYLYLAHDSLTGLHTQNVAIIEATVRARLRTLIRDGDLTGAFEVAVWDVRYDLAHP